MTGMAMQVTNKYIDALNRISTEHGALSTDAIRVCMLLFLDEWQGDLKMQAQRCDDHVKIAELTTELERLRSMDYELTSWLAAFEPDAFKNYASTSSTSVAIRVMDHYRHAMATLRDDLENLQSAASEECAHLLKQLDVCRQANERLDAELKVAYAKSAHDAEELERLSAGDDAQEADQVQPVAVDVPVVAGLAEIIRGLDSSNVNWSQLDKPVRKAVAAFTIRRLSVDGKLPISRFETERPPYVPTSGAVASMFGVRWSELVAGLCQAKS